jgi:Holliday junction resolvasome RuvABC DNA-binding subunit
MVDLVSYREALARIPAICPQEAQRIAAQLARELRIAQERAERTALAQAGMNTARAACDVVTNSAPLSFSRAALCLARNPLRGVHSLALLGWV